MKLNYYKGINIPISIKIATTEISGLLRCDVTSLGIWFPTFRERTVVLQMLSGGKVKGEETNHSKPETLYVTLLTRTCKFIITFCYKKCKYSVENLQKLFLQRFFCDDLIFDIEIRRTLSRG
jgi:hypothetical protein